MLLSDLNREQMIFRSLAGLIVDEAHQFVQTASRLNETVFSYTNWKYVMGQIGSDADGQLLHQLMILISDWQLWTQEKEKLGYSFDNSRMHLTTLLTIIKPLTASEKEHTGKSSVFRLGKCGGKDSFSKVAEAMDDYIRRTNNLFTF